MPTRAAQLADRVEAGEALSVTIPDYGPGWWVVGVDRSAETVTVRRDGVEKTVGWSQISE